MPVVPLRERVVEIVLDLGTGLAGRYRYGSGFRLGGRGVGGGNPIRPLCESC